MAKEPSGQTETLCDGKLFAATDPNMAAAEVNNRSEPNILETVDFGSF